MEFEKEKVETKELPKTSKPTKVVGVRVSGFYKFSGILHVRIKSGKKVKWYPTNNLQDTYTIDEKAFNKLASV